MTPHIVPELIEGFRRSKTMFTALELGVLEVTPITAEAFAKHAKADTRAVALLLDVCVSPGLLTKADVYLNRLSPHTPAGYATHSSKVPWRLWDQLRDRTQ